MAAGGTPWPGVTRQCAACLLHQAAAMGTRLLPTALPTAQCARGPVPSAGVHRPRLHARRSSAATPAHPTWYTSRRPQDYTTWLIFSPSTPGQSRRRSALPSRPRQSWAPNILTTRPNGDHARGCPFRLSSSPTPHSRSFSSLLPRTPQIPDASHAGPGSRRRLVLKRRPSPTTQLTGILRHQTPCSRCRLTACH